VLHAWLFHAWLFDECYDTVAKLTARYRRQSRFAAGSNAQVTSLKFLAADDSASGSFGVQNRVGAGRLAGWRAGGCAKSTPGGHDRDVA
jgi:hypothetical protein